MPSWTVQIGVEYKTWLLVEEDYFINHQDVSTGITLTIELYRYKSLLDTFMKFRKAQMEQHSCGAQASWKGKEKQRNEIPNSDLESST